MSQVSANLVINHALLSETVVLILTWQHKLLHVGFYLH